ncbi:MAG: hypothetical protein JWP94_1183 [Mucilaginibacter sp.]|nr:hypothetical protein [Mucilaginibacter sp.]
MLIVKTIAAQFMKTILEQFKQLLIAAMLLVFTMPVSAQVRRVEQPVPAVSPQLKEFYRLAAQSNITFLFPAEFIEIKAPNNEYFSFDYAVKLPDTDFELWFQLKSDKENWMSYVRTRNHFLTNPDSAYVASGAAHAIMFTGGRNYLTRTIPPRVLARYNADAGKSYLLTLLDMPETKHYKYALLITLHKNHTGTITAMCLTNEKGPEFFKNIKKAENCLKFKP